MMDLSNPQVLKNHLITQMKEGHGTFQEKTVIVFTSDDGMEFICPPEVVDYRKKLEQEAKPAKKANK